MNIFGASRLHCRVLRSVAPSSITAKRKNLQLAQVSSDIMEILLDISLPRVSYCVTEPYQAACASRHDKDKNEKPHPFVDFMVRIDLHAERSDKDEPDRHAQSAEENVLRHSQSSNRSG